MRRAEALWLRIIGVLLILLGLTLLVSPGITYRTKEKVIHSDSIDITARRQKTVPIPHAVALLTVGAGVGALILASRKPQ